jgi:hypothetical protein
VDFTAGNEGALSISFSGFWAIIDEADHLAVAKGFQFQTPRRLVFACTSSLYVLNEYLQISRPAD